jgi:hypothetical protein
MTELEKAVEEAVDMAWDQWASEHPALARVIGGLTQKERMVELIRDSDEFRQAKEDYVQGRIEIDVVGKLVNLAGTVLNRVLGL